VDLRRRIPSVERLLSSPAFRSLLDRLPRSLVTGALQAETERVRSQVGNRHDSVEDTSRIADADWYAERVETALDRLSRGTLHPVINATGVILHTNLGRAPLAAGAVAAVQQLTSGYCNLEYDLETGGRGSRYTHCRELLVCLTGASDALVVNNNAAALVLALNTLSRGRDAVISRGELVEIGGAFRIPDIMQRSGAHLREVGTTNRTRAADYSAAMTALTGAILKVHPSNFTMDGFTAEATPSELAQVARHAGVPLIYDIGSGLLLEPSRLGLGDEPSVPDALTAGADVVTLSGDKLLGGPQCGIILGSTELVQEMRENPLCRAFRVDRMTLGALAATLRLYLDPERAMREVPVLRMITRSAVELRGRAEDFAHQLQDAGVAAEVTAGMSAVGGGAAPHAALETALVRLAAPPTGRDVERRLRAGDPPVVCRIADDRAVLDLRTVEPGQEAILLKAVVAACRT
jgi:L-seryl-tRNA(Ser) seleniumtransferase